MTDERREQAIILRQQGSSIKDIAKQLNAAQSSVSIWVRGITLSEQQVITLRRKTHAPEVIELRRQRRLASEDSK